MYAKHPTPHQNYGWFKGRMPPLELHIELAVIYEKICQHKYSYKLQNLHQIVSTQLTLWWSKWPESLSHAKKRHVQWPVWDCCDHSEQSLLNYRFELRQIIEPKNTWPQMRCKSIVTAKTIWIPLKEEHGVIFFHSIQVDKRKWNKMCHSFQEIYSSSWLRRRALPLVTATFNCAARSTIAFLFSVDTLCAISALYFLPTPIKIMLENYINGSLSNPPPYKQMPPKNM